MFEITQFLTSLLPVELVHYIILPFLLPKSHYGLKRKFFQELNLVYIYTNGNKKRLF